MALRIVGPVARKQQYDRIPMEDALGRVSAFVHTGAVHYRPLGGTSAERCTRATIIAAELGGTVHERTRHGSDEDVWVAIVPHVRPVT